MLHVSLNPSVFVGDSNLIWLKLTYSWNIYLFDWKNVIWKVWNMNDEASKIYGFTLISKAFFFSENSLRYPD